MWKLTTIVAVAAACLPAHAQDSADELAKQLSNPVASLISVPLQYNADFNIGSEDGTKQLLNVQPVIPTSLSDDWNLITRVIVPVVHQDDVFGNSGSQFGLGDTTPTLFFSPKAPTSGGWIWGVGPVFLLPTATDDVLGAEKWGVGPSALALKQTPGGWTVGVLANHIWSVAGEDARADVSATFLQPFLARQLSGGRTLSFNLESSYDWKGDAWNVPVNIGYSKVTKWGGQMLSLAGGVRYYLETPGDGPDWGVRFTLTLLYPER
ncbi:transporter [Pseudoxanthomonas sp. SL93]|uniref:transporter n=1 Tax=Pseudoxanthomonas sp. SL93 TaxID=2995142 RepID=UPI00226F4E60|nr:transporter [Pseudoxanthomonas sp. SL93]WAC63640.1 transporter [Pseudoxanthomonas sp. SL93]